MRFRKPLAWALGAIWVGLAVASSSIYRWVDDAGKTHYSDVVPERYRKSATLVEPRDRGSPQSPSAPASARSSVPGASAPSAVAPAAPSASASASAPRSQARDCATLRRLYDDSVACFAPYRTVKGAIKAEAFDKCTVVDDPTPVCGYP